MVEVFKTNVEEPKASEQIIQVLLEQFPSHKVNFDLEDCDKILRVHGQYVPVKKVIELVKEKGYECEILV